MTDFFSSLSSSRFNPVNIRQRSTRFKAFFALALVSLFWGTTWVASRQGVLYMPALQLAGIRQLAGGLIYLVFFLFKGIAFPKGKEWWPVLMLSLLNFVLSNGLATWGVKYISGGLGAIIAATFPLWLVIIGLVASKTKIPVKAMVGLLVGFGGVCVIFYEHLHDFLDAGFRAGILLSVAASWTWALGTYYTKEQVSNFNPYFSLGLQMTIAGFVMYCTSWATGMYVPITQIPWESWLAIGYLVLFGSVIAFIAYLYALQNLPASLVSVYAYLNPVVAVIIGWLLFSEHLTIYIAAGGVIILAGVYIVNESFRQQRLKTPHTGIET